MSYFRLNFFTQRLIRVYSYHGTNRISVRITTLPSGAACVVGNADQGGLDLGRRSHYLSAARVEGLFVEARRIMPQAIVDPAEIRRFAQNLKRFTDELQGNLSSLHGQLKTLSASWRDQEHEKFVGEFEQTTRAVAKFVQATQDHIPFLLRKAQRAEEYLDQR